MQLGKAWVGKTKPKRTQKGAKVIVAGIGNTIGIGV